MPLLLISLATGIKTIEQKPTQAMKFDPVSILLIAMTFIGLILGFSNMGGIGFMSLPVAGAIIIGLAGLVGLVYRSLHIDQPVIDLRVLGNASFAAHVFCVFCFTANFFGNVIYFAQLYAISKWGNIYHCRISGFTGCCFRRSHVTN